MSKNEFDALLLKKLQEEAFEYNPDGWKQLSERLSDAVPAPIETDNFDALLVAKLQEDNFEYEPKSWQQLAERLEHPEGMPKATPFPLKKWGIAIGSAAALLLTIGLAAVFNNGSKNDDTGSASVANNTVTEQQETAKPTENNTTPTPKVKQNEAVTAPQSPAHQQSVIANSNTKAGTSTILNPIPNTNNPGRSILVPGDNKPEKARELPENTAIANTQVQNSQPKSIVNQDITAPVKQQDNSGFIAQNQYNQPWPDAGDYVSSRSSKPKTNISFAGGVNYGNINTGYTAGVSVKQKIGGDFFVDGTVAMMYNNNANNVAANNGPSVTEQPPSNIALRPAKGTLNSVSAPALAPIQKLYYVQMNPSFGYQIEDKVALSVGGDFQKMLNKTDEIVQPDNTNTKIFPTMDIGLTTKSEFTISPNLQAGLLYREGLNNIFKADAPYVNRRYLQVQFKYNIPLK